MPASDIPDITVPQEEGAIREALADLDRKLAVHVAAVRDAEARLGEIAQRAAESTPLTVETAPREEAPPPRESVVRVPLQRLKDVPTQTPAAKGEPGSPAVEKAAPAEPTSGPAALSDDEALPASLDEAASKAIRVMRRLNPNRSVQDLLKQIKKQKDTAGSAAKPAAKSWFRRR